LLEIDENITELNNFDINKKKVEDKIRLIVKDNLEKYIQYLEKLKLDLENLKEDDPEDILRKINEFLFAFDKKSVFSFQKANFLVGEELENTRKKINKFVKNLSEKSEGKKELIENSKKIKYIEEKLTEIKIINKNKAELENLIKNLEEKRDEKNKQLKIKKEEIKKILQTKEYIENIKNIDDKKIKAEEMKKEINLLKESIEFKKLANIFHEDQKKMTKIKYFKENLNEAIEKNNTLELIEILKEGDIYNDKIKEKIEKIEKIKIEISEIKISEDKTIKIEEEMKKINIDIENIEKEIKIEKIKIEKIEKNKEELDNMIKINLPVKKN
jgi:hypothetical protein